MQKAGCDKRLQPVRLLGPGPCQAGCEQEVPSKCRKLVAVETVETEATPEVSGRHRLPPAFIAAQRWAQRWAKRWAKRSWSFRSGAEDFLNFGHVKRVKNTSLKHL